MFLDCGRKLQEQEIKNDTDLHREPMQTPHTKMWFWLCAFLFVLAFPQKSKSKFLNHPQKKKKKNSSAAHFHVKAVERWNYSSGKLRLSLLRFECFHTIWHFSAWSMDGFWKTISTINNSTSPLSYLRAEAFSYHQSGLLGDGLHWQEQMDGPTHAGKWWVLWFIY